MTFFININYFLPEHFELRINFYIINKPEAYLLKEIKVFAVGF